MLKPILVPFDSQTGQLLEVKPYQGQQNVEWRNNARFTETMTFFGITGDRHILLADPQGNRFKMFMTDFEKFMHKQGFDGNKVTATFVYSAKGPRYGIKLA